MESTRLEVFLGGDDDLHHVGVAYVHRGPRELSTTFSYAPDYLADPRAFALEPALPLTSGAHHQRGIPRSFGDSAPDRWGRNLVERAHRLTHQGNLSRGLDDLDFLLGVSDATRHGALRFQSDGEFQSTTASPPPQVALETLLEAAKSVERDEDSRAVFTLLDAGSHSLGGARPKASIALPGGDLALAKFPRLDDPYPVMALEALAHDMAEAMGIQTVPRELVRVVDHEVLVLHRFDRQGQTRIPYLSAMTLLGTLDHEGGDYVALAQAVRSHSAHPRQALQELFDRVLHSVMLHNTDDHLRNHGFLRTRAGWVPSPVFDVNPTLEGSHTRATSIAGAQHQEDEPEGVLALAPHCGLDPDQVVERIDRACAVFSSIDEVATRRGIDARTTRILTDRVAERSAALTRVTRKVPRSQPMAFSRDRGQLRVGPGHPRGGQFARKQEHALASS